MLAHNVEVLSQTNESDFIDVEKENTNEITD